METARNHEAIDQFEKATVNAAANNTINEAEAIKIEQKKSQILGLIEETMGFRDVEKKELKHKLDQQVQRSSIDGLNTLNNSIKRRQNEVNEVIGQYFNQVDNNEHLFAKRAGYDAAKMYKEEFIQLSDAERQFRLNQLAQDIAERQKLHEELSAYASPEALARMRRSEMRKMVLYIKGCDRLLIENKGLFTESESHDFKAEMADCTSPGEQQRLMTKIANSLEKRKSYASIFKRLPAEYQRKWGDISTMSLAERTASYEKLVVGIEREYEKALQEPFVMKHIAPQDRAAGLAYVRSEQASGGDKFRALKGLRKMAEAQKKTVSDPFEQTLKEFAKYRSPKEMKKEEDRFYDASTYEQRKQLSEALKLALIEAQAESQENSEMTKEYKKRLEAGLVDKIIGKKTLKEALKRWENKTLEEKRDTLAIATADRARRAKLLKQFKALPKEIKDKNTDFYELTHTDRVMRMEELSGYETSPQEETDTEDVPTAQEQQTTEVETAHETPDDKIEDLTALAATATRNQKYELAIKYYQEVLAIDPYDELTKMSLKFVEGKLKQQQKAGEEPQLSTSEKNRIKQATEAATNSSNVMKRRRRNTMSETIADQQKKSEAKHGSANLNAKKSGLTKNQQKLAEQVVEQTGGTKMMVDGKAEDTIWSDKEGYRDLIKPENERKVEAQLAKGIASGKTMDNIVLYNNDGSLSNASSAEEKLKKRTAETEDLIVKVAKNKLNPSNDNAEAVEEAIQEEVKKKDLDVKLRAA